MTAVRAVLFDLDGTLLDTAPDLAAALDALRLEQGLEGLPFAEVRPLVSHGARALVRHGFAQAEGAEFEVLRQRFLTLYAAGRHAHSRPFAGVTEALDVLDACGIPWGIVTNKPESLTGPLLAGLGLAHRVRSLVCGDTLPERKPHPRPLLHAATRLGVAAADVVYVGDAERDVLAARAAGMRAYVALYGYIPAVERPRDWPAQGFIDSSQHLAGFLQLLLRTS